MRREEEKAAAEVALEMAARQDDGDLEAAEDDVGSEAYTETDEEDNWDSEAYTETDEEPWVEELHCPR